MNDEYYTNIYTSRESTPQLASWSLANKLLNHQQVSYLYLLNYGFLDYVSNNFIYFNLALKSLVNLSGYNECKLLNIILMCLALK